MSRSRLVLAAVAAAAAAGLLSPAAPAQAAKDPGLKDIPLSGICPGQTGDLKSIIAVAQRAGRWSPFDLYDPKFVPLDKRLVPYQLLVTGEGLKTRHLSPGVTYTRPGRPPRNPVTCELDGATKESGAFHIQVVGKVRG